MRQAVLIGGLSAGLVAAAPLGAAAQEEAYRSVAYSDPYFTQQAAPAPTPTFAKATPRQAPRAATPVAPPRTPVPAAYAAPAMPSETPRAARIGPMNARPMPIGRPAPAQATLPVAPPAAPGRVMRGRVEGVFGWERLRGDEPSDAVTFGVTVGADRKVASLFGGAAFLGPYGSVRFSGAEVSAETTDETTSGTTTVATTTTDTLSEEREVELGLRLGWATDRTALFASAGYVNARAEAVQTERVRTTDTAAMTDTEDRTEVRETVHRDGWRLGAGTEVTVVGDLYWKAEYGYTALDEADDRHQVTTGVGLRF